MNGWKKHQKVNYLVILSSLCCWQIASAATVNHSIESMLQYHALELQTLEWSNEVVSFKEQWLFDVYQQNAFAPLWVVGEELDSKGKQLYEKLLTAGQYGLNPDDYNAGKIKKIVTAKEIQQQALLDVLLTEGMLRFIHDITEGRLQAQRAFPELFAEAGNIAFDPLQIIATIHGSMNLKEYLDGLGPQHTAYKLLEKALVEYQVMYNRGGWPEISEGKTLYPGNDDPRVRLIQQLLSATGDMTLNIEPGNTFDKQTVEGVKRFQLRHGLQVDGIVGKETLAAMNISVEARIQQIKLNLERWRWHDQELGEKYVFVNIAGFDLKAVENDNTVLEMAIIVGKRHHESPIFSDKIRYAEFNPFWNLPPHIARTETLRHLQADPEYLEKKHIRVFSSWQENAVELDPLEIDWNTISPKKMNQYKFRQDPGKWNALGTMKFVFPNKYAVYLHDTPNRELFKTARRAYSHGCIRLSNPEDLAVFLLGGKAKQWDRARVKKIVDSSKRTVVRLPERIPVHITYMTSWYDDDGLLHFNQDIYKRDEKLQIALAVE